MRRTAAFALALAIVLALAACGGAPDTALPTPDSAVTASPSLTPRPSESGLVLAVVAPDETTSALLEICREQGEELTVREYGSIGELLADAADGFPPDMFYLPALGEYAGRIAALALDLSPYLGSDTLLPGLYEALGAGGSLPYIAYDFTLECFAVTGGADISSADAALSEAEERGEALFPTYWTRDALTSFILPFLQSEYGGDEPSFDSGDFAALLEAAAAQGEAPGEGDSLLEYMPLSPGPGMLDALDMTDGAALTGLPGEGWRGGLFAAEHCFGILGSCEDPDAAWSVLSALLGDEAQSLAGSFPAVQSAFDERLAEMCAAGDITEAQSELVAELAANTRGLYAPADYTGELIRAAVTAVASGNMSAADAAGEVQRLALEHLSGG